MIETKRSIYLIGALVTFYMCTKKKRLKPTAQSTVESSKANLSAPM